MNESVTLLFDIIDQRIDSATKVICNRIYSQRVDVAWTPEQRKTLAISIRKEFVSAIQGILGTFDNIGSVLPNEISGWKICSAEEGTDIRIGSADYADMWLEYLWHKEYHQTSPTKPSLDEYDHML